MRHAGFGSLVRLCESRRSSHAFLPNPLDRDTIASALRLAQLSLRVRTPNLGACARVSSVVRIASP